MTSSQPRPNPLQRDALSAWEDEGGATRQGDHAGPTTPDDGPLLAALGAAVVVRWNILSRGARKALFGAAVTGRETSSQLARYLRAHRHDDA